MKFDEIDMTRAGEAWTQYHLAKDPLAVVPGMDAEMLGREAIEIAYIAARLAREGWTPPDPLEIEALKIVAEHMSVPITTVEQHRYNLIMLAPVLAALRRGMELAKP